MKTPEEALSHWRCPGSIRPTLDAGLINRTFTVGDPPQGILQWVNPIFSPEIHHDIAAVTQRLKACGLVTPELQPTRDDQLWLDDTRGCWRLLSYIPGRTVHRLESPAQAAAAGALVGRFHRALTDWSYTFKAPRRNIHQTPKRMVELTGALEKAETHPLGARARQLGEQILQRWQSWDGELDLPEHPCHGDLKISNLRFSSDGEQAICLLDLDTLEPMSLASELGDAWRSWCNIAGEDRPEAVRFDREIFAASTSAWLAQGPELEERERRSLVPGIERICLELAARFCADVVNGNYFLEDRRRFSQPGEHNLHRATGQLHLAAASRACRHECEDILNRL